MNDNKHNEEPRIVVYFVPEIILSEDVNSESIIEDFAPDLWQELQGSSLNCSATCVFEASDIETLDQLTRKAVDIDPSYQPPDFRAFYYLDASPDELFGLLVRLKGSGQVRTAYIDQAGPDPTVNCPKNPRSKWQGYLNSAPAGVGAKYACNLPGGDGEGQGFIDFEQGWILDHEDLCVDQQSPLHGKNSNDSRSHGASVLGVVCAVDNCLGCIGIAPNIKPAKVVSYFCSTRPRALVSALANLEYGEVLLLEAQVQLRLNDQIILGPMEAYDCEYELILLATTLGFTVVEVGGNGTYNEYPPLNMDCYKTLDGRRVLKRNYRDSGAIMVTAASSKHPHVRLDYAPFGTRIDCYAWGENIATLGSNLDSSVDSYKNTFSATSGASAIIAGVALSVQGRAEKVLKRRYDAKTLRTILSDPCTGTMPSNLEPTRHIGVMPDLRKIFDLVIK